MFLFVFRLCVVCWFANGSWPDESFGLEIQTCVFLKQMRLRKAFAVHETATVALKLVQATNGFNNRGQRPHSHKDFDNMNTPHKSAWPRYLLWLELTIDSPWAVVRGDLAIDGLEMALDGELEMTAESLDLV